MPVPKHRSRISVDTYLALERASGERHLYLDGEIYAMAGESGVHADICMNLSALIHAALRGKECRARSKDTKVRSGPTPMSGRGTEGFFSYPDLLVICGEPETHDAHGDVVLNPSIVMEVLSPSTEAFDRGEKFRRYQSWNPTLTDYLLVSQDKPEIEHFTREASGGWHYQRYEGLDAVVTIASIGCTLALREVYERVTFAEE